MQYKINLTSAKNYTCMPLALTWILRSLSTPFEILVLRTICMQFERKAVYEEF